MKNVYCVCYNNLDIFKNKELAIKFFSQCYYGSEGSEHDRYGNILVDLMFSDIGKDNVSDEINEIILHDENNNVIERIKTNWKNYKVAIQEFEEC